MRRRLRCERARDWIELALDDRLDEASRERLEAHLAECADCRRVARGTLRVRELLARAPAPPPLSPQRVRRMRASLEATILREGDAPRPPSRLPGRSRWAWALAAAAAFVVVGVGVGLWRWRGGPADTETVVVVDRPRSRSVTSPSSGDTGGRLSGSPSVRATAGSPQGGAGELPSGSARLEAPGSEPSVGRTEPLPDGGDVAPETAESVTVVEVRGSILVREAGRGASRRLSSGDRLAPGTSLSSASAPARITLDRQLTLALDSSSTVTLVELRDRWGFRFDSGRVVCEVEPSRSGPPVEMSVEGAVVRVTGTVFSVDDRRGEARVRVLRGHVVIAGVGRGVMELRAGQELSLSTGEIASLPEGAADDDRALLARRVEGREGSGADSTTDVVALFRRADELRRRGERARACAIYRRIAALDPVGATGGTALISLGQLSLGSNPSAARRAFRRYLATRPGGALAQEALAGLIRAEQALGHGRAAREAARRYLRRFPGGRYAERARRVLAQRSSTAGGEERVP